MKTQLKFIGKKFSPIIDCNINIAVIEKTETYTTLAVTLFTATDSKYEIGSMAILIRTKFFIDSILQDTLFDFIANMYKNIQQDISNVSDTPTAMH